MSLKLGFDAKVYYQTDGISGTAGWNELLGIQGDVTLDISDEEIDTTIRSGGGWKGANQGLRDASVEFELLMDPADAGFVALRDAHLNRTLIGIRVLDDDSGTSGAQGLEADMAVLGFSRGEPIGGELTVSITMKPTYSPGNTPNWYTVP